MQVIQKISKNFATLNAQYLVNKNRNAVRFETQNVNWNFEQVNYQSYALIKGLLAMRFKAGDNFLIKTPQSQQAQAYVTKIGTAGIGANLYISRASTAEELDQQIQKHNINCMFFEPTLQMGNKQLIDTLNDLAPELSTYTHGTLLKLNRYPNLRSLIQTNFYSFPGVYKFRAVLNYASDKFSKIEEVNVEPLTIPSSSNPIIITEPAHDFAFKAGVLNSLVNGRFVTVVQPSQAHKVCSEVHNNNVDLIATEETPVDRNVRVIVQKGSNVMSSHSNRVEV